MPAWSEAPGPPAPKALQALDYATLPAGSVVLKLTFTHEIRERPPVIATYHPVANVVLDFADTASELLSDRVKIAHRDVRSVQVLTAGGRTRIVINLNRPVSWEMEAAGRDLLLTLRRPDAR